jgi:hypothetical protein
VKPSVNGLASDFVIGFSCMFFCLSNNSTEVSTADSRVGNIDAGFVLSKLCSVMLMPDAATLKPSSATLKSRSVMSKHCSVMLKPGSVMVKLCSVISKPSSVMSIVKPATMIEG